MKREVGRRLAATIRKNVANPLRNYRAAKGRYVDSEATVEHADAWPACGVHKLIRGHDRQSAGKLAPSSTTEMFIFQFCSLDLASQAAAATVPAGFTKDGAADRLADRRRQLDDSTVLRAAAAYEAASPWKDKWPLACADGLVVALT